MADEERDTSKDKKVDVEAKATVSDDKGEKTHEVDVKATADVKDVRTPEVTEADENRVVIQAGKTKITIDVDDPAEHEKASVAADRPTAKATAPAPRAFASSGRVD